MSDKIGLIVCCVYFINLLKIWNFFVLSKIKQKCVFYEIDIERHRVRLMAYENRNAAYDLSLFDDSSDYVPGSAAPERKEEVHKKQERKRR